MKYALDDILPLEQHGPKPGRGGRPSCWDNEVPSMFETMYRAGLELEEMAARLGVHETTLRGWLDNKPALKAARKRLEREYKGLAPVPELRMPAGLSCEEHLELAEMEAIRALRRILSASDSDSSVVSAAREILDRVKGKPVQQSVVDQHTTYTIISAIPAPPNSIRDAPEQNYP